MYKYAKRPLDFLFALGGLIIFFPFFLPIAIWIKLDSKGPVIFQQDRLGLNGKVFKINKLRTMSVGTEIDGVYEKDGDSRVTKIGRYLRKTSVDELPQLWNILKGDMSLIGPRPPLTYHPWTYEEYTNEQKKMFNVRPGVTGWAQINGRKNVPWPQRIEMNIEYVDNLSFKFDVKIFFKTILKVVRMEDNVNMKETA